MTVTKQVIDGVEVNVDVLDVGAAEIRRSKPLQLDVEHDGVSYSLRVTSHNKLTIERKDPKRYGIFQVDDLNIAADVIGYVLRRAICRGIDTAEIIESANVARVDLGVMPK